MTEVDAKMIKIINDKLQMEFRDRLLVKPLKPIKVTIKQEEPVFDKDADGKIIKDENGVPTYSKTETVVKKVDSTYRKGIILKTPYNYNTESNEQIQLKVGDIILYPNSSAIPFDQLKDAVFVNPYNVVARYNEVKK